MIQQESARAVIVYRLCAGCTVEEILNFGNSKKCTVKKEFDAFIATGGSTDTFDT
jgi:hypothetical protein